MALEDILKMRADAGYPLDILRYGTTYWEAAEKKLLPLREHWQVVGVGVAEKVLFE